MSSVLLDSHVVLWIATGEKLSPEAIAAIDGAMREGGVFVSAISAWEIARLSRDGRIVLAAPTHTWLGQFLIKSGFTALPLNDACATESVLLPEPLHRDPADGFLIATARHHDLTLVTRDEKILQYAKAGHVKAVAC